MGNINSVNDSIELVHGGDWAGYRQEFGRDALDFSANVSPLGLPQGVAEAIKKALPQADRYPDPLCRELRAALSAAEAVPAGSIICGNGAAELIYRFVWAVMPRRALVLAPTFAEYEAALKTIGCEVRRHMLAVQDDFEPAEDILDDIDTTIDAVFICQPNNPTGKLVEPVLLQKIIARCKACGARLLVDECFLDFLPEHERLSAKYALAANKGLFILKAFTKIYGMAGVRLGYAMCSDTELLAKMRAAGQPWAVSSLAQAAGMAALRENEYAERVRALIARQRPLLEQGLRALGLRVVHGRANYILFRALENLGGALRTKGVVLRSCANYCGLDASWYRTAVRTAPENEALLKAIGEALQ